MKAIFVLSGGPCAGKTSLLAEFRLRGFEVIEEAAAEIILEGRYHPSKDPWAFQREVLRRQISREAAPGTPGGPVFADRAVGDHFGYLDHFRSEKCLDPDPSGFPAELDRAWGSARQRYRAIFILEPSPRWVAAPYRREDREEGLRIHERLRAAYRARHEHVIEIPWEPLPSRVDRVLRVVKAFQEAGYLLPDGGSSPAR